MGPNDTNKISQHGKKMNVLKTFYSRIKKILKKTKIICQYKGNRALAEVDQVKKAVSVKANFFF